MNKAEELVLQMEMKDCLNELTKKVGEEIKKSFPTIKELNVSITVQYIMLGDKKGQGRV